MFADDTVVFYAGKSAEEIESVLNGELENIFRYSIKNDLTVNLRVKQKHCYSAPEEGLTCYMVN